MGDLPPDVAARLARAREEAIRAKREGVLLTRRPLRAGEAPRSYIGGLPRLPEDLEWPLNTRTGLPLSFIGQIDLRQVPRPQGVFFPAEGLLWFFADFSAGRFTDPGDTRVLFDPHPRSMDREREAPANLPPLDQYDRYGWRKAQHPRAFVEPQAGLFFDLFDTFYERPYEPDSPFSLVDVLLQLTGRGERREEERDEPEFGPGVYSRMIKELREEALHRAIGPRARRRGYWVDPNSGFGEVHRPATSIDAEYALMVLADDRRFAIPLNEHPCPPEVVADLAARLQEQIGFVRGLVPRPLAMAERIAIKALVDEVRQGFARFDVRPQPLSDTVRDVIRRSRMNARRAAELLRTPPDAGKDVPVRRDRMRDVIRSSRSDVRSAISRSYPHAAFEILRTMPEAEKYVPAEFLDPYQEWTAGGQTYFHQMFGHASSLQNASQTYQDYALLLEITGSPTLGFCFNAVMHYWIPKRDLAEGRFDRVEATWEFD